MNTKKPFEKHMDSDFKTAQMCSEGGIFNCVAVKRGSTVKIKDTKNPDVEALDFTQDEWRAFIDGVKRGEFDI